MWKKIHCDIETLNISFEERLKVDTTKLIKASHDVATTNRGGMDVIAKELDDEGR